MADGEALPLAGKLPTLTGVALQRSPFSAPVVTHTGPGCTVQEIVDGVGLPAFMHGDVEVYIGDHEIERLNWALVKPKLGATVNIRVRPRGGDGAKDVMRSLAQIAVMVVAAAVGGMFGGIIGAVVTVAVTVAGNMLVNALIPPPGSKNKWGFDQELGNPYGQITGLRNQMAPYGPIPRVIGQRRMFPMLAGRPYTETVGNDQYLRLLLLVGLGPLKIEDIKLGETPIGSYPGIQIETREGWPGDAPVTLYQKAIKEDNYSVILDAAGTTTTKTTRLNTKEISVEIVFPSGVNRVKDGELRYHEVSFTVQYRVAGSGGAWINADWLDPSSAYGTNTDGVLFVRDKTQAGLRRSGRWTVAPGQYEVKITRTSPIEPIGEMGYAIFTTLRSIVDEDFLPADGMALIALRMKASGQLNGVPDQINCVASSYLPVYNEGTSTWAYQITRNPAWGYADILRRRGTEVINADSRLDLPTICDWAADCDSDPTNGAAPYWTFDGVLEGGSIFTALRTVAAHGRASFTIRDGKYSVVRDSAQTVPVQHISPRNSWNYSGSKVFADLPHALRIRFSNEEKQYADDEVIVYRPGYSVDGAGDTEAAYKFETLDMPGCSRAEQAWREGMYHFAVLQLRPDTHTVSMDVENLRCVMGSYVKFSHDAIKVGQAWGRIKARTLNVGGQVTGFILDSEVLAPSGTNWGIVTRDADFTSRAHPVAAGTGAYQNTVTFVTPVAASAAANVGDLFQFGELGLETAPMIVKRITPGPNLTAVLQLVDAQPGVWTADQGTIPEFNSYITTPPPIERVQPPAPVMRLSSDSNTARYLADSTVVERIAVSFDSWPSAEVPIDRVEVQYRDKDESPDFTPLPPQPRDTAGFFIDPVYAGVNYEVRARTVSPYGLTSEWVVDDVQAAGKTVPPGPATSLTATNGVGAQQGKITLNWGLPTDVDLWATEIWASATNDRTTATKVDSVADPAVTYDHALAGVVNRYYWLRMVDLSGNLSTWFPVSSTGGVLGQTRGIIPGDLDTTTPPANVTGTPTLSFSSIIAADGTEITRLSSGCSAVTDAASYVIEIDDGVASPWTESLPTNAIANLIVRTGRTYRVRWKAVSRTGSVSASWSSYSSSIATGGDTTAPGPITSPSATGSTSGITLSWVPPTDADFQKVKIYRNTVNDDTTATYIGEALTTLVTYRPPLAFTTYYFWGATVDRTGNIGTKTLIGSAQMDGRVELAITSSGGLTAETIALTDLLVISDLTDPVYAADTMALDVPRTAESIVETMQDYLSRLAVYPEQFGAQPNQPLFDCAPAILLAEAYAAANNGKVQFTPSADYYTYSQVGGARDGLCWIGDNSSIVYVGPANNIDIVKFGDDSTSYKQMLVQGISIRSFATMVAGASVRLPLVCRSVFRFDSIQGQDFYEANGNHLFNGIYADRVDQVLIEAQDCIAGATGFMVRGALSTGPKADCWVNIRKIAWCATGILMGGAFGGLYLRSGTVAHCGQSFVANQSLQAENNRELFIDGTIFDVATNAAGGNVVLDDPGALLVQITGAWIASGAGHGLWIKQNAGTVDVVGTTIRFHAGDGFRNAVGAGCIADISGGKIHGNAGYGINPTASGHNTRWNGVGLFNNTAGAVNTTNAPASPLFSSWMQFTKGVFTNGLTVPSDAWISNATREVSYHDGSNSYSKAATHYWWNTSNTQVAQLTSTGALTLAAGLAATTGTFSGNVSMGSLTVNGVAATAGTTANSPVLRDANGTIFGINMVSSSVAPTFEWLETDGGTNAKGWIAQVNGGVLSFATRTDAYGAGSTFISATRSGTTVTALALTATAINLTGAMGLTGALVASGTVTATSHILDANSYFTLSSSNPVLNFDPNDYLTYNRTANVLYTVIGGATVTALASTGLTITGGLSVSGTITAGTTITGNVLTTNPVGNTIGYVTMQPGNSTKTGYFEFRNAAATRFGYMGFVDTASPVINMVAENGAKWAFTGGNVGIGTNNPSHPLTIQTSVTDQGIRLNNSSSTALAVLQSQGTTAATFRMLNNGVQNVMIRPDGSSYFNGGNVGIGTNAPYSRFHTSSADAVDGMTLGSPTGVGLTVSNVNQAYGLNFGTHTSGRSWIQAGRVDGTATAYNLSLQASGGNVGIGTTTPATKLDVSGTITGTALAVDAQFYATLSSGNPVITFDANDAITYDRTGNTANVVIGGTTRGAFSATGLSIMGTLSTTGVLNAQDEIRLAGASFYRTAVAIGSGGGWFGGYNVKGNATPATAIQHDSLGTAVAMRFDATGFRIFAAASAAAGTALSAQKLLVDANGAAVTGTLSASGLITASAGISGTTGSFSGNVSMGSLTVNGVGASSAAVANSVMLRDVNGFTTASGYILSSASPGFHHVETDQAAGGKVWSQRVSSGSLTWALEDDAYSTPTTFMTVVRSGLTVSSVNFATSNASFTVGQGGASENYSNANYHLWRSSAGVEWMRLVSGNVGIGTAVPTAKLQVLSSGTALTASAQTVATFQRSGAAASDAMVSIVAGNAANSFLAFGDTDAESVGRIIYNHTANSMALYVNSATRLTIDNAGLATFAAGVAATSFSGSGASLTGLNGSNISTGTVPDARLSSQVMLKGAIPKDEWLVLAPAVRELFYFDGTSNYYKSDSHNFWTNSNALAFQITATKVETTKPLKLPRYTVSGLPTASSFTDCEVLVTDALSPVWGSTVASGGSQLVKVRSNGTNWICA